MKKVLILSFLGTVAFSNESLAGACEASTPAEMAAVFGVDAAVVKEELTYERKTTSECMWRFQDAAGYGHAITFRTFDKTAKITNPDFFKNNQKHLAENGKKVGKWDLKYRFEAFPNTEHGVVSSMYGNRFTKSLHYVWIEGEARRLGVTYSRTVNEKGEMKEPTVEALKMAVKIFTD